MARKAHEFQFRLEIDLHCYFHITCALLEDFEYSDNFDHILKSFSTLKVGMARLEQKVELYRVEKVQYIQKKILMIQ